MANRPENFTIDMLNTDTFPEDTDFGEHAEFPLTRERLDAIPIATPDMTTDELRKICVDYVKLSVSFQWYTDRFVFVPSTRSTPDVFPARSFYIGKLNGGIPYINTASGSLYRILEFYDEKTGLLDTEYFSKNPQFFGTACSGTAGCGWHRVVNSAEISWTHSMNVAHGFIPVGPYKYDHSQKQIWEKIDGKRVYFYNAKTVCKENGEQVMFESYALTLPADCYSSNGHVRMCAENPVVVRNEDGTIDGEKSYVVLVEQGLFTKGDHHKRKTSDGIEYLIRGNDGHAFTFIELFNAGYLVHTFAELIGTKKVDIAEVGIGHEGETINGESLYSSPIKANYPISDIFITVKDENGEEVKKHIFRVHPHYVRTVAAKKYLPEGLCEFCDGKHTIEISAQLFNGQKLVAYTGTLCK
ncbi:MAG: hypothetical protein IKD18_01560 [Clostridia bacterium]|nr:hypothetical protein [Clostridia bacterium]